MLLSETCTPDLVLIHVILTSYDEFIHDDMAPLHITERLI